MPDRRDRFPVRKQPAKELGFEPTVPAVPAVLPVVDPGAAVDADLLTALKPDTVSTDDSGDESFVETEGSEAQFEMAKTLEELRLAVPEVTRDIAVSARDLRTKLLERIFRKNEDSRTQHDEIIGQALAAIGVSQAEYEVARVIATIPAKDFPATLQAKRRAVCERIIIPIDQALRGITDLRYFFPDAKLHRADLYEVSYEYASAHSQLDTKPDKGRDGMTGLYNDLGFLAKMFDVELKLLALLEEERAMAVFRIDLDGFKAVNDRYTHEAGDKVLREFSANLSDAFRRSFEITSIIPDRDSSSIEGRPGGDEFVLMVNDIDMTQKPKFGPEAHAHYPKDLFEKHDIGNKVLFSYALRIMEAAAKVILPDGTPLSASIGYMRINKQEASQMLYGNDDTYKRRDFAYYNNRADAAAQEAKEWGNGVAREFSPKGVRVPKTYDRLRLKLEKGLYRDNPKLRGNPNVAAMLDSMAKLFQEEYQKLEVEEQSTAEEEKPTIE